jgi:hypothetical protein
MKTKRWTLDGSELPSMKKDGRWTEVAYKGNTGGRVHLFLLWAIVHHLSQWKVYFKHRENGRGKRSSG